LIDILILWVGCKRSRCYAHVVGEKQVVFSLERLGMRVFLGGRHIDDVRGLDIISTEGISKTSMVVGGHGLRMADVLVVLVLKLELNSGRDVGRE
jgi:hypothetical protein